MEWIKALSILKFSSPDVFYNDEDMTLNDVVSQLSVWERLKLWACGYVYLRREKREGWKGYLPIYLVHCKKHGYFEDYPHGYNMRFDCPKCAEEKERKANKVL